MTGRSTVLPGPFKKYFKTLMVLTLFGILFLYIPLDQTVSVLMAAQPVYIAALITLRIVLLLISSYKLHVLLAGEKTSLRGLKGYLTVTNVYFIGRFFSNFLPTSFGGDVLKVRELTFEDVRGDVALAGVFMDRLTGILAVLLMGIIVALPGVGGLEPYRLEELRYPFLGGTVLILVPAYLWGIRGLVYLRDTMRKRGELPGLEFLTNLIESLGRYRHRPVDLGICILYSLAYHLLRVLNLWVGVMAVQGSVDPLLLVPVIPIVTFVGLLPVTVNNLGLREGTITYALVEVGLSAPQALAVALLTRVIGYIVSTIGGVAYLFRVRGR